MERTRIGTEDLAEILKQHYVWLKSDGNQGTRAILDFADLRGRRLRFARLERASLAHADLTDCDLRYANLSGVHAPGANFTNCRLTRAQVSDGDFRLADFTGCTVGYKRPLVHGTKTANFLGSNFNQTQGTK